MRLLPVAVAVALGAACAGGDDPAATSPPTSTTAPATPTAPSSAPPPATGPAVVEPACTEAPEALRTDVTPSGNRWFDGVVDLETAPVSIGLDGVAEWIVPLGDGGWHIALEDGRSVEVDTAGALFEVDAVDGDGPPLAVLDAEGRPRVVGSATELAPFDDPLPDGRAVHSGPISAALVSPTDRYPHAVLGDDIEAAAVEVLDRCTGERTRIEVGPPDVIEGVSPLLADLDGDGIVELLVTTANDEVGARLEAYRLDGTLLATSDAVGRGRRWRNQLGVAPLGPNGELEIVDVQTPHLGGIVRFSRLDGDELVLEASIGEFTSHVIGSRNLDLGILADTTADGRPEMLIYTQDRFRLVAIERTDEGAEVVRSVELGARGVTNLAVQRVGDAAVLALGTADGRLLIWSPS
ncbi:MAG: hypothetical protein AAFZ07_23840 [Actinomycetota bacterium]